KSGSRSFLSVARELAQRNEFTFYKHILNGTYRPKYDDLISEVEHISSLPIPGIYHRHMYFTKFEKFGYRHPIYINMIRDPVDQWVSLYYFRHNGDGRHRRGSGSVTDINDCILNNLTTCEIPKEFYIGNFFCGQTSACSRGSYESVEIAKRHIDEDYFFVGLLEEFETSLQILEKILPKYFFGAMDVWREIERKLKNETTTLNKHEIKPETREILRKKLRNDYEVYFHIKHNFNILKKDLGFTNS
ncbi:uronyl 2-sulfotransferase-like, partial [Styela clava]